MSDLFISYAQNFEDVMLWRALAHIDCGTYVDIGAQDPIIDSASLAFYERGWRGIHAEPAPAYAELLRRHRPDEEVVEAVVGDYEGTISFYDFHGTGLSTARPDIARQHQSIGYECHTLERTSVTLDKVLGEWGGRDIHWLKVDVEGLEREVLKGWTTQTLRPWIIVIEGTHPLSRDESGAAWEPLVLERGYEFVYFDGLNRFYISKMHSELKSCFHSPPNVFDRFALSGTATSTFCAKLNGDLGALQKRDADASYALLQSHAELEQIRAGQDRIAEAHREQIADANQYIAELKAELGSISDQLSSSQVNLAESRSLLDLQLRELYEARGLAASQSEELASVRKHAHAVQIDLAAATSTIEDLTRQTHKWWTVADNLNHLLQAVYASRSWRLTAALRQGNALAKRWLGSVKPQSPTLAGLSRRAVRRLLVLAWAHVQSRPERRAMFARLAARFPRLYARLRAFAFTHASDGLADVPAPVSGHIAYEPPSKTDGRRVAMEIYPSAVERVYAQLIAARVRENQAAMLDQRSHP